ncbi:hypothetical protein, partial [Aeromonas salmonicida]|uniref:hypothetical protein n=1 Tax=Aeromonas salmonicida TaxID=645 RepID=UPI000ACD7FAC
TKQILSDAYTVYCGQLFKNELIIAALSSMIIVFVAGLLFYLYIGILGKKQSEDEITGGRTLVNKPRKKSSRT